LSVHCKFVGSLYIKKVVRSVVGRATFFFTVHVFRLVIPSTHTTRNLLLRSVSVPYVFCCYVCCIRPRKHLSNVTA